MVQAMKPGSVVVDVAVDQGGCIETSRPTTHSDPTYVIDEVVHYCVANMPGAVGRTSTFALCNVTLPWVIEIADSGIEPAAKDLPPVAARHVFAPWQGTDRAVPCNGQRRLVELAALRPLRRHDAPAVGGQSAW